MLLNQIEDQFKNRNYHPKIPNIKINLYKNYEVLAVASAIESLVEFGDIRCPDCFMVGDSYLMTHLGFTSTKLNTGAEKKLFLQVMLDLVFEVGQAIKSAFAQLDNPPYLIADMPDGSFESKELAIRNATLMINYGADAVKIETSDKKDLDIVEVLSKNNICVVAHIGYTPQTSKGRRYGDTLEEALSIFELARAARDFGAQVLVLERTSEVVYQTLCVNRKAGIPCYAIFSGKSSYGGQSLNVWDSVFHPSFKAHYFPPTSSYSIERYPEVYTFEVIKSSFLDLLRLTFQGDFPISPPTKLSVDEIEKIRDIDPWR